MEEQKVVVTFNYELNKSQSKPLGIQLSGSFDKWQVRHAMAYDPIYNKFSVILRIKKGTYHYKYIVDGEWVINKIESVVKDHSGFLNNVITI